MRHETARADVVACAQRMLADDLTVSTSGNISVRCGDLVAITPSGVDYGDMTPADVCLVDLAGEQVDGDLRPSVEVPMHTTVYRRFEQAAAIVHTHPLHTTALSLVSDELPAVHYMVALLGGPVPVVPYATYGTQELADASARGLDGRTAVILQNHGATTVGDSLQQAYTRSLYLEWMCHLYLQASAFGQPNLLSAEEIDRVTAKLAFYGQRAAAEGAED